MRFVYVMLLGALPALAQEPKAGFCVENQDTRPALFTVDAGPDGRVVAVLASGERLCTPESEAPADGFVSVFYDETAIEGCSRLALSGTVQVLLNYADFDNCTWQLAPQH